MNLFRTGKDRVALSLCLFWSLMAGWSAPSPVHGDTTHFSALLATLAPHILPYDSEADLAPLMQWTEKKRFVLLGEATHGTAEFYLLRAAITRRLILENNFTVIALEASYPRTLRLDAYINGADLSLAQALTGFRLYPAWMWRNHEFIRLLRWLRQHNAAVTLPAKRVRLFGLDLYGMYDAVSSLKENIFVLDRQMWQQVTQRLACFDGFGGTALVYGDIVAQDPTRSCRASVAGLAGDVARMVLPFVEQNPHAAPFAANALQNARVVETGEEYFRLARQGDADGSWNLRDRFMTDAMETASWFFDQDTTGAKVVLWAHNSHIGDISATSMGTAGQTSIGRLTWERFKDLSFLVGFLTAQGTVAASSSWDGEARKMSLAVPPATSLEHLLSRMDTPVFYFHTLAAADLVGALMTPRLQRFIGVQYYPMEETRYHYSETVVPGQYDAVFFIKNTRAVTPVDTGPGWQ